MTSSPEVTTFGVDWVSFGDKNTFKKRESSNAFSVPEGIIVGFVASMEYFTNVFKYPYSTFMN